MFMDRKTQCIKTSVLPTRVYRSNAISIKILASYFVDTEKLILKFITGKRPRIVNSILKNIVGELTLFYFKSYY